MVIILFFSVQKLSTGEQKIVEKLLIHSHWEWVKEKYLKYKCIQPKRIGCWSLHLGNARKVNLIANKAKNCVSQITLVKAFKYWLHLFISFHG